MYKSLSSAHYTYYNKYSEYSEYNKYNKRAASTVSLCVYSDMHNLSKNAIFKRRSQNASPRAQPPT